MKAIEKIIQLPESKILEFKRDISSFKPILKTIVAFANTAGGTIVIGVDDDKTVIGLEDVLQAEESLASSVSDGIMPGMMPEIEIVSFQGVHLLLIKVARWRGPFYLKSQGPEQGVYIRLGSTNRKAGDEILEELKRSSSGIYFDQMPCIGSNETDCHIEDVKSIFDAVGKTIFSDRMEIQNPGMLPFGMTLDDFKAGVSKVRNRVICRVFRELGLMEEWGSGYSRIIKSCRDGGYPEPEWIEQGLSVKVAFRPHPETHEENVPVNVPVNVSVNVPVNSRQQWFLDQVKVGVKVSANDIAGHWKVSEKTAKRDIADLKKKRLIKFSGAPKNGSYFLK